jgi:hypothetical protein
VALTVCVAAARNAKLHAGTVPVALTVMVHSVVLVDVSVNVTVPVGSVVPVNAGVMTAVKATGWLTTEAVGEDDRLSVVVGCVTVRASRLPLFELDPKFVSPL